MVAFWGERINELKMKREELKKEELRGKSNLL
jgi:hypothetical protein